MADRTRWEYRTVVATTPAQLGGLLPHHGWTGWELVSVVENEAGNLVAFLKRPASRGQVDWIGRGVSVWVEEEET